MRSSPSRFRGLSCLVVCIVVATPCFAARDPLRFVNPFVGTGGHGHTFPGATVPFGLVQVSPDTRLDGWDGCSGYHFDDTRVWGFSHTHLSGTGVSDYGDVLFLPGVGAPHWRRSYGREHGDGDGARFEKRTERASPGYYAVTLADSRVNVELTATARTGWHRYTFPASDSAYVLVDLESRDEVIASSLRVVDERTIEGERWSRGWARDQRVFFVARFSRPFRAEIAERGRPVAGAHEGSGTDVRAALRFDLPRGGTVVAQVGVSGVDVAGARAALAAEAAGRTFDGVHAEARTAWGRALSRIEVEGGTPAQDSTFYTALYHTLLQPNVWSDVDGRYRGRDGEVHRAEGWTPYTVFSLWDTFRAAHPLYTLLEPERTRDFVATFLAQYRQGGRLPVWELSANETDCMIGYHSVSVIADAWAKGIRGFDPALALEAMVASADDDRRGLAEYRRRGYVPGEHESEGVSKTLEYAYDDWCIASFAESLGATAVRDRMLERAQGWRHLLDPATGLMRPRIGGRFKTPFDPTEVDFHFTEANSWQYSFFVPHDIAGHMAAVGGRERYAMLLDSLFGAAPRTTGRTQADITGLIGQYAHGNEPSHHMAYLYAFAGRSWRTQALVRRVLDSLYTSRPDGLSGNEDCGQMSAWYVLSAMGFYPVTPGRPEYVVGSPLFRRATLRLPNGRRFTVRAEGNGPGRPYVRAATLNGVPLARPVLTHEAIVAGGELVLVMGDSPDTTLWSAPDAVPVSAAAGPRVTAAPHRVDGAARFRGAQTVRLASAEPGARVSWLLLADGVPVRTGEGDTVTVDRTATLRWRAEAPGARPSPEEEASFRRIADARRMASLTAPHRAYTGDGADALLDGVRGGEDFRLPTWMGFYGTHVEAVVDLGAERTLRRAGMGFLQDQNSWIFMPRSVAFEVSQDGVRYEPVGEVANTVDDHTDGVVVRDLAVTFAPRPARWLRVRVTAPLMCPDWHKGSGNRSFVFADEIEWE